MANFDGTDDIFDSRDVLARIAELISEWEEATGDTFADYSLSEDDLAAYLTDEAAAELVALIALRDAAQNDVVDFEYGEAFISEDYFEDYAKELAKDTGAINQDATWPLNYIDWTAAAGALKQDYTVYEFQGTTYYARA